MNIMAMNPSPQLLEPLGQTVVSRQNDHILAADMAPTVLWSLEKSNPFHP